MNNAVNKRTALLIATLASFLTPFMGSSINIALPSIGKEFAMDAVLLSWVATSYLLAAAMFLVPFGKIADIHSRYTWKEEDFYIRHIDLHSFIFPFRNFNFCYRTYLLSSFAGNRRCYDI